MSSIRTTKVTGIRKGKIQKVYDIGVEKNHNFFANRHLVSNCFQESWMVLAQKLSGFTDVEADEMRKTLVKKSLDTNDKKAGERVVLREKFVKGAKEINGLSEVVSNDLFDKIEFFSLYGFSKNHSVPYVIDSYYAAWLHTYYETDWLSTVLQSETGNPANLAKAIAEIKSYGYQFAPVDINYSGSEWEYSEKINAFVPPLSSVKGIGDTAMEEIMLMRPYKNLQDLFYNADGEWKHSKMNKTCLSALCKIEALSSLEDFQKGEVNNHRQLLEALTTDKNYANLRKGLTGLSPAQIKKSQKLGIEPPIFLFEALKQNSDVEDWNRIEKIELSFEMTSTVDADLLFPSELMEKLAEKEVPSVLTISLNKSGVGWFVITDIIKKKTKNGKGFYRFKVTDNNNQVGWVRAWGDMKTDPEKYTLWMAQASNDSWGLSTSVAKMRRVV